MTEQAPPRTWRLSRGQRPAPPAGACPNCGTPVGDRFCPHCGQSNRVRLVSLGRMLADAADDQFSLGAALPRTLGALFLRPGHLTREYVAGRIARYVPPFRLYLVASLLFFVALSFLADADLIWSQVGDQVTAAYDPARERAARATGEQPYDNVNIGFDSTRVAPLLRPAVALLQRQEDRLNALPPREALRVMVDGTMRTAPKVVFALLPLFALMLKGLYRKRLYVEHFVFSLHVHAFAFLLGAVALLVRSELLAGVFLLWTLGYLFAAMKRGYGQGWLLTAGKYLALVLLYFVAVNVGIVTMFVAMLLSA